MIIIVMNNIIPIYIPNIDKYKKSAIKAINDGWISNHGEYIKKSNQKLSEILNVPYVILMSNGTCATHCLFLSLKFKYPNIKKIYVSNNCFVAAWNCMFKEYKDFEIMRMDIDTWNIDTSKEEILKIDKNSCVFIIHNVGNIINVPRLKKIRPDLIFIEDNCEGFLGKYENSYSGCSKDILCSSVSFYGNKTLTTGEGGAFFTHHKYIYDYIKSVYSQGMTEIKYLHDKIAYNYRMTNIQAAFLYDQLNDLENILKKKKEIFDNYKRLLRDLIKKKKIIFFKQEEYTLNTNWIFTLRILNNPFSIEETNKFFKDNKIDIRPFFYPIDRHKHFDFIKNTDLNSYILNKEIIFIPSYPELKIEKQIYIVKIINKFINLICII